MYLSWMSLASCRSTLYRALRMAAVARRIAALLRSLQVGVGIAGEFGVDGQPDGARPAPAS